MNLMRCQSEMIAIITLTTVIIMNLFWWIWWDATDQHLLAKFQPIWDKNEPFVCACWISIQWYWYRNTGLRLLSLKISSKSNDIDIEILVRTFQDKIRKFWAHEAGFWGKTSVTLAVLVANICQLKNMNISGLSHLRACLMKTFYRQILDLMVPIGDERPIRVPDNDHPTPSKEVDLPLSP